MNNFGAKNCTLHTANKTENTNQFTHIIEKDGGSVCDIATIWEKITNKENIAYYNLVVKNEG